VQLQIKNIRGDVVGKVQVSDDVFAAPARSALVHQVVVGQMANRRQGTSSTKNRSAVSGGGAKPRPQKGTGRARAGTIRAPHFKGGGVVFGPSPRSYRQRTPKKMKRLALIATLSDKARENRLVVLENLDLDPPKTKEMVKALRAVDASTSVLLVADGADEAVLRSARNIPRLKMIPAALLNTLDLVNHAKLVMTVDAVRKAEQLWAGRFERRKIPRPGASEDHSDDA
jgi:large subunit ribosomal protein L4